jgi:hypothetical protein
MEILLASCVPASFGMGKEEVLMQHTEDFATNFELLPTNILQTIKTFLAPKSTQIIAELYKLNVYRKDGFFKAHVDTPKDAF